MSGTPGRGRGRKGGRGREGREGEEGEGGRGGEGGGREAFTCSGDLSKHKHMIHATEKPHLCQVQSIRFL